MRISVLLAIKIIDTIRTVLLPSFKIEGNAKFYLETGKIKMTIFSLSKFTDFPSILGVSRLHPKIRTSTLGEEQHVLKDIHLYTYLCIKPNTYFINKSFVCKSILST